ncbi:hypothetical protein D3C85_1426630 [compost metagenome]
MQHRRQHFPAHSAVGAIRFLGRSAAVGEAGEQVAVQVEFGHQRRLPVGIGGHLIGPADVDPAVELLDEARRQCLHGLIEQRLTGLLLCRAQPLGLEL